MAELSPMMKQYFDIKKKYKDTILMFRLGDFYEMFYEDAKLASKELELTLTGRDCGQEERAPMCGVPYHSCEGYIARLVSKGYKVAICEQTEDPKLAKGLVKRDIVRVITPGTVIEGSMLDEARNNYICSLFLAENRAGICFCDISTGALSATEAESEEVETELGRFAPKEIIACGAEEPLKNLLPFIKNRLSSSLERLSNEICEPASAEEVVLAQFGKQELSQVGLEEKPLIVRALGALFFYLKSTQMVGLERISAVELYNETQFMRLDLSARRNLELIETMRSKEKKGSLLWVLDKTRTAMGKRLIRSWIEQPLVGCAQILRRQNAVEELCTDAVRRADLFEKLSGIYDLERLMTRIVYGSSNGRELRSLGTTLARLPELCEVTKEFKSGMLSSLHAQIDPLSDVCAMIGAAIVEDPPFTVREGGIIRRGYNEELDFLTGDMSNGKSIIARIEAEERERTGISKLKVGYNRVFGYYIEVSNSFKEQVPEGYIRKQTLTGCERYITQELKELETRILGSHERAVQLEYQLFDELRRSVASQLSRVQQTARAIAQLDVLCSFAETAVRNNYCRPEVNLSGKIVLKDSRHPVVETLLEGAPFVPNDVLLDAQDNRVAIITGPNMAGKSTYMRQAALIVLMAQIGSFVPASKAEIGIVDSIFTRVGASDDLASGQSTFMVEMSEVAQILKNATQKSLLILDEIGRGTSTFDGMSIARAVLEYVADQKKLGAKTMFATHYHELTVLENMISGVKNYNIAVKKRGDNITFLRRIVRGGADDSYGIEVAKLAGIPDWVVSRAKRFLKELEKGGSHSEKIPAVGSVGEAQEDSIQTSLVPSAETQIAERLRRVDVNTLTPIEALNTLFELTKLL